MFYRYFTLFVVLSFAINKEGMAEEQWTQLSTRGEKIEALVEKEGDLHFPAPISKGKGLCGNLWVSEFEDSTRCELERIDGRGGLIAMTEAGFEGTFLAICREAKGEMVVRYRVARGKLETSGVDASVGKDQVLRLTRRGDFVYAHLGTEPLVALPFEGVKKILGGVIALDELHFSQPQMTAIPQTQVTTFDLGLIGSGVICTGNWSEVPDPASVGKSYLRTEGKDDAASASVEIKGLLAGEHELWVRYAGGENQTENALVTVEGLGAAVISEINQKQGAGLWVALGSFQSDGSSVPRVKITSAKSGSGALSLDAVHHVWSGWKDDDKDGIPDMWAASSSLAGRSLKTNRTSLEKTQEIEDFRANLREASAEADVAGVPTGKVIVYVDGGSGDDSFDGKALKPRKGPWVGKRGGPVRTMGGAKKVVPKKATHVELHLSGQLDMPLGGFADQNKVYSIIVDGTNGASLQAGFRSFNPEPTLPPPPPLQSSAASQP